jgi:DNA repair protein RecN (Recombination protein N)
VFDLHDAPEAASHGCANRNSTTTAACQLRRTLRADGGSKAWINGRPATIAQLAELAGRLVEIHGQHEHQALMSRGSQLALLDAFGRHAPLGDVQAARAWSRWCANATRCRNAAIPAIASPSSNTNWQELQRDALEPAAFAELVATHRAMRTPPA